MSHPPTPPRSPAADVDPPSRIDAIDILRGLAIFIMVPANMAPSVYAEPHEFWFRLASSFAAPAFIAIAGLTIALTAITRKYGWKHYLIRGALLLLVAAFVDVLIIKVAPFLSYDVLYLIGIACPLTYLFMRLPRLYQWSLISLIFLVTPVLQSTFGYTDYPGDVILWGDTEGARQASPTWSGALRRLLIDGWFPLFPWLGLSFAGAMMGQLLLHVPGRRDDRVHIVFAAALLAVGIVAWWVHPGAMYNRQGFSELFYPPTLGFILTAWGAVWAVLWMVEKAPRWPIFEPLVWLGQCSLLMYVLHLAIIAYVLEPIFSEQPLSTFLTIAIATVCALVAIAAAVRHIKRAWPARPYLVRFLLG